MSNTHIQGLLLFFFLWWPAGPPEQISRWPNGSFGGPDAANVLMSTCTMNPSAFKQHFGWPAGPLRQFFRWPNGSFGGLDAVNILMSTCTVNPSARICLSPQMFGGPAGPLTRVSGGLASNLVAIGHC